MNHETTIKGMKEKKCTVTFIGERYEQKQIGTYPKTTSTTSQKKLKHL